MRISLCAILISLSACAHTVAPAPVHAQSASWSGNTRDSGLKFDASNLPKFDAHSRDRYNTLIDTYGKRFTPALKHDDGLTAVGENLWAIDNEHLAKAIQMNQWRKAGQ